MVIVIAIEAYHPDKTFDFWLENMTAVAFMAVLALTYTGCRCPMSLIS